MVQTLSLSEEKHHAIMDWLFAEVGKEMTENFVGGLRESKLEG
jgi:hypothetical protein